MVTANMHEAKSRLSELVKAVEEIFRRLIKSGPALKVKLAPCYDPAGP